MSAVRRVLVVANPRAGRGTALRTIEGVRSALEAGGCALDIALTEGAGHAESLIRERDLASYQAIVAAGGDGTLHEVVNGLMARGTDAAAPPVGLLPAGTGDALARDLGLADAQRAAEAIASDHQRAIDLARVTVDGRTRHAFSVVGWGAFARINRRAEHFRPLPQRYDLAAACELLAPRLAGARASRDGLAQDDAFLGVACLTSCTGRGMRIAPGAVLDDGLMDLIEVRRAGRVALARLLRGVFDGSHVRSPLVSTSRVARFGLDLEPGSSVVLDGEALPAHTVEVEVLPGALRVLA